MASKTPKDQVHRTLRIISAVSAAFGVDINVITMVVVRHGFRTNGPHTLMTVAFLPLVLSILWAFTDLYSNRLWNSRVHPGFYELVDGISFLSFLALLITNGIILTNMRTYVHNSKVVLMTYNTLPWVVCATIHLIIFLRTILRSLKFNRLTSLLRPHAVCPDCSRIWHSQTRGVADEAGERLIGENEEEYLEADPKGKGAIRLEEDAEDPSIGHRS